MVKLYICSQDKTGIMRDLRIDMESILRWLKINSLKGKTLSSKFWL